MASYTTGNYPQSYSEAVQMLYGRHSKVLPGRSTELVVLGCIAPESDGRVAVVYHQTAVVTFYASGHILLDSGGYTTLTTRRKMNACLSQHRVWCHQFQQYVTPLPGAWPDHVAPEGQAIGYGWRAPHRNTPSTVGGTPFPPYRHNGGTVYAGHRVLICPNNGVVAEGTPLADRAEFARFWQ